MIVSAMSAQPSSKCKQCDNLGPGDRLPEQLVRNVIKPQTEVDRPVNLQPVHHPREHRLVSPEHLPDAGLQTPHHLHYPRTLGQVQTRSPSAGCRRTLTHCKVRKTRRVRAHRVLHHHVSENHGYHVIGRNSGINVVTASSITYFAPPPVTGWIIKYTEFGPKKWKHELPRSECRCSPRFTGLAVPCSPPSAKPVRARDLQCSLTPGPGSDGISEQRMALRRQKMAKC